ncbi:MAG TPA: MFS transporter, partial [Methylomirabilota bacterium]|nr:MFS transporter [Methylomirabilota bacterium]
AGAAAGAAARPRPARWPEVVAVALVVLGGSTQVFFLAAILPQVLPDLGVDPDHTLEIGGIIVFASGAAAALGAVLAPWLSELLPERRLLAGLLVASSAALAGHAAAGSLWLYGLLRFVQVLCIAPVFPIVVAGVAQSASGEAIGVINSARIGSAFLGPVVATSVLASASPAALYLLLAAAGLACVPLVSRPGRRPSRPSAATP